MRGTWLILAMLLSVVLLTDTAWSADSQIDHDLNGKGRGQIIGGSVLLGAGVLYSAVGWTLFGMNGGQIVQDCSGASACDGGAYALMGLLMAIPAAIGVLVGPILLGTGAHNRKKARRKLDAGEPEISFGLTPSGWILKW